MKGVEGLTGDYLPYTNLFNQALRYDQKWREVMGDFITKRFTAYESTQVKILIMGIAYSPNFSDFGNSAGLQIAEYLHEHMWDVAIHDPIISDDTLMKATAVPAHFKEDRIPFGQFDVIFLATAHDQYKYVPQDIDYIWRKGQIIIDATGEWERYRTMFKGSGATYIRVGEKGWRDK